MGRWISKAPSWNLSVCRKYRQFLEYCCDVNIGSVRRRTLPWSGRRQYSVPYLYRQGTGIQFLVGHGSQGRAYAIASSRLDDS